MARLTRKSAIKWHREMWNYIADVIENSRMVQNIGELKREFLRKYGFQRRVQANCFLCEYTKMHCDECPLKWGEQEGSGCIRVGGKNDGLFFKIGECKSWQKQAELARKIANLPEKEE